MRTRWAKGDSIFSTAFDSRNQLHDKEIVQFRARGFFMHPLLFIIYLQIQTFVPPQ
jgi:hypothetical protein